MQIDFPDTTGFPRLFPNPIDEASATRFHIYGIL
jgi:hypothetical protein